MTSSCAQCPTAVAPAPQWRCGVSVPPSEWEEAAAEGGRRLTNPRGDPYRRVMGAKPSDKDFNIQPPLLPLQITPPPPRGYQMAFVSTVCTLGVHCTNVQAMGTGKIQTVRPGALGAPFPPPPPRAGLCLKGRVPSGQSRSGCRAVTGGVKAVGGGGYWRLGMRWGAGVGVWECLWGRVSAVGGGRGVPPPPFKRFPALEGAPSADRFHTMNSRPVTCSECVLCTAWVNSSLTR